MEQSGGRSRVLCWKLRELVCFAGGDTSKQGKTREIKGNQRKPRGAKGNQGESMESRENQVTQGKGNKGIFIVRGSYVYEGMSMYWWCVFLWVMEGVWETKGKGRRRWRGVGPAGRPSLFPFGGSVILKI